MAIKRLGTTRRTRSKPTAKQRVIIREVDAPATVVDQFHGWVFVRADSDPDFVATLREDEVEFNAPDSEQVPGVGTLLLPLGISVAAGLFGAYWLATRYPPPDWIAPAIIVALAVAAGFLYWRSRRC